MSSARVVRCWVKSRNERNPYGQLLRKRTLARLPLTKRRKAVSYTHLDVYKRQTLDRASMATITNPDDLNALEAALKLKDATGCEVVVVTLSLIHIY